MKRKKVCAVITARPSYSRVRSALSELRSRPDVELQIVAAASALVTRFGRVVDLIRADGFTVSAEVASVVEGDSLANSATSTGLLLSQLSGVLAGLKPDVVVTIADRHETIATAIAASYQHIPLCHIQGGEVSGSIDDKVRNAVTQLADLHLVSTHISAERVRAMKPGAKVAVTGCPSIDLAADVLRQPRSGFNGSGIIVLQHPVTSESEDSGDQMRETIKALHGLNNVHYFWPGEDSGGAAMSKELRMAGICPTRNLPTDEFLSLLVGADCLVGNSSAGIREGSYLGVPVVNVGSRQANRERGGNVADVPHCAKSIRNAVEALSGKRYPSSTLYGDGHAGERIASILAERAMEAVA